MRLNTLPTAAAAATLMAAALGGQALAQDARYGYGHDNRGGYVQTDRQYDGGYRGNNGGYRQDGGRYYDHGAFNARIDQLQAWTDSMDHSGQIDRRDAYQARSLLSDLRRKVHYSGSYGYFSERDRVTINTWFDRITQLLQTSQRGGGYGRDYRG